MHGHIQMNSSLYISTSWLQFSVRKTIGMISWSLGFWSRDSAYFLQRVPKRKAVQRRGKEEGVCVLCLSIVGAEENGKEWPSSSSPCQLTPGLLDLLLIGWVLILSLIYPPRRHQGSALKEPQSSYFWNFCSHRITTQLKIVRAYKL